MGQNHSEKTSRAYSQVDQQRLAHLISIIVDSLEDDKAENIVVIDLEGKASFADRMVIATGLADRQIKAMAEHLDKILSEQGIKKIMVEGSSDWVLLDIGDIIVHLFREEIREHYNLERIWGIKLEEDAPTAPSV